MATAMNIAMGDPVPFIDLEGDQCIVRPEAISILQSIKKPLVVVAVAGKYRTGKSFLMNRLSGKSSGFSLGGTVQSHTKGFWMWCCKHPFDDDKCLVLIDAEGLGDVERGSATHDTKLFSLSVLLSSVLVYNSIGTIDSEAMNQLQYPF